MQTNNWIKPSNLPDKILRYTLVIIMLAHSIPSFTSGDIKNFGDLYLNKVGFAPFGVFLAYLIKISHIVTAICLIINRFLIIPILFTLLVLIIGIFMVHLKDGWYVVRGGRNGIEYNVLLIACFLHVLLNSYKSQPK